MAKLTPEDIVAKKMLELVKDVTLDLEVVGYTIALISPTILQNRLQLIIETAYEKKRELNDKSIANNIYI
jgi:hypothetical protein